MSEIKQGSSRYRNPDNDPRGPYVLTDCTVSYERPSMRYEWRGKTPPKGRSWRFSRERAEELEREGRITFSSSGMPRLKRYLSESSGALQELLRSLPTKKPDNELDFIKEIAPRLIEILDYVEQQTFYDSKRGRYRADVVLADSITSRPWAVLEFKRTDSKEIGDWVEQLGNYLEAFQTPVGAVISPESLLLIRPNNKNKHYDLRTISLEQSEEILSILERSGDGVTPEVQIPHTALIELIEAAERAETNLEKGHSLEAVARFLFSRTPALSCKYSNLQTRSSEIDLVVEYDRSKGTIPLFEDIGRYALVECKNWSKPVGAKSVRDFLVKLEKCQIKLGILFSKNGVTGVDAGADALREIQSQFDRSGVYLLVFSLSELRFLSDGNEFLAILDRKADNLGFDAQMA